MSVIPRDKVLDKIRKLIALSGSSNVHEAAVAAAAAQRLMLEHRIAESDVTVDATEEDVVVDQEIYRDRRLKSPPRWHEILLNGIANANFCRVILGADCERIGWRVERRPFYRVIGSEADRATTVYLYEMLRGEIERLAVQVCRCYRYDRAERASFKLGAAGALSNKLLAEGRAFRNEMAQASNAHALAVIDKTAQAVEAYVRKAFPRLSAGSAPTISRRDAYAHGHEMGSRIDVARPHRGLMPGQKGLGDGTMP